MLVGCVGPARRVAVADGKRAVAHEPPRAVDEPVRWTSRGSGNGASGRPDTMRKMFRQRMAGLGLLPPMQSLTLIVSSPTAIETLRKTA
jgi:hypothetical protein